MLIDNFVLKKIWFGIVVVSMFFILAGCRINNETVAASDDILNSGTVAEIKEPKYISETSKEDCLLCSDGQGTLLSLYRGEENVAVISLNTFEVSYIGINRYDNFGRLIEELSNGNIMKRTGSGEGGFTLSGYIDPDRGYARCHLYFNNDEFLSLDQIATHMCTDCMNRVIVDDCWGEPTGMAIINFNTGNLRILRESLLAFQFEDSYVSCDAKRDEVNENDLEMDLLIFYCPKRYAKFANGDEYCRGSWYRYSNKKYGTL